MSFYLALLSGTDMMIRAPEMCGDLLLVMSVAAFQFWKAVFVCIEATIFYENTGSQDSILNQMKERYWFYDNNCFINK